MKEMACRLGFLLPPSTPTSVYPTCAALLACLLANVWYGVAIGCAFFTMLPAPLVEEEVAAVEWGCGFGVCARVDVTYSFDAHHVRIYSAFLFTPTSNKVGGEKGPHPCSFRARTRTKYMLNSSIMYEA
mmetsp:Transcript_11156/g.29312  ORF Transcript_11156/g.29312 Transcript_11156/m.29312 type:complete len:129 (+) Transcript_11156:2034-2420(+)